MVDVTLYHSIRNILNSLDELAADGAPVCLAITSSDGALAALLRMPGVPGRIEHMAKGKAYTSAKMGCTTSALHDRLSREYITLADFMDPGMTSMPGGVPLIDKEGGILLGIGVSGRTAAEDEVLALRIRDMLQKDLNK